MGAVKAFEIDGTKLRAELKAFAKLLKPGKELGESSHLLPFFKHNRHLAAFMALSDPNLLGFEVALAGGFTADIIVGDSRSGTFCFIELEDAKKRSIFAARPQLYPAYSARFERGFSQVVDWLYLAADLSRTDALETVLGARPQQVIGLLMIGRTSFCTTPLLKRLQWRQNKVLVDSQQIKCLTFDSALSDAKARVVANSRIARS